MYRSRTKQKSQTPRTITMRLLPTALSLLFLLCPSRRLGPACITFHLSSTAGRLQCRIQKTSTRVEVETARLYPILQKEHPLLVSLSSFDKQQRIYQRRVRSCASKDTHCYGYNHSEARRDGERTAFTPKLQSSVESSRQFPFYAFLS
ncbi:hypothetical protein G7K_5908-t1 [Saitoella complicata NRRL Y-17804]|uniref:Secreted protein n=1 Tax=Saitoella complicata (strain BCRC 22490 / CBS 7301 / JCM 7358 / NBRC 10748 / NRRL Y-17804) TaxID=698492 RepID=A0A0E9NPL1_SAICN|nr:hypothetical protein G7K_5908-t1 [Saitoella complicata NRRL Y-17804]